jgi:hypothetical protein
MVHDFIDHFVKFKHETNAVKALCREVYQDMQKKGRAIKDHLFFTKSSAPLLCYAFYIIQSPLLLPARMPVTSR